MRTLLTVALSGLIAAAGSSAAYARDKNDPAKNPEPRLKAGAAAPALKADKWLQGAEVKEFAPGKVYVVEFWATWCGPCIGMMPHLGQLQAAYRDKGLTVIGFTSKDPNNTAKKVREFIARRGPKLGYTFAYADDSTTHEAWMGAAGQNGIPCSFVIDKTGHIAFIGHPMYLDDVLPAVIAGTWKAADGPALVEKLDAEMEALDKAADGNDAAAGLKAFAAFEARHPRMAQLSFLTTPKLSLLIKARKFPEVRKLVEEASAQASAHEDANELAILSDVLRPAAKADKELGQLCLRTAEAALKLVGDDSINLAEAHLTLAEAHFAVGDQVKAKEYRQKALAIAQKQGPEARAYIEQQIKELDDQRKDEAKEKK